MNILPFRDSGVIVLANVFGSIFFGFVVFTTVGWLSHMIGVPIGYIMSSGEFLYWLIPKINLSI